MKQFFDTLIHKFYISGPAAQQRKRIMSFFAMAMVFVTVYSLILPAVAFDRNAAAKQSGISAGNALALFCRYDVHKHTDLCYEERPVYDADGTLTSGVQRVLICGKEDFVVHEHDDSCFKTVTKTITENGRQKAVREKVLVCTLPENPEHKHTAACYEEQMVLICGQSEQEAHLHTEACWSENKTIICVKEEHMHGNKCYSDVIIGSEKVLQCGYQEGQELSPAVWSDPVVDEKTGEVIEEAELIQEAVVHNHDDSCYQTIEKTEKQLACGKEEHRHSDECYAVSKELVCGKEETRGHRHNKECFSRKKILICGQPELHTHTLDCYEKGPMMESPEKMGWVHFEEDENGRKVLVGDPKHLICGRTELLAHQHDADCFLTEEEAAQAAEGMEAADQKAEDPVETASLTEQNPDAEIEKEVLMADGSLYSVTVVYGEDAKIPEGSALRVTPFEEGTEAYEKARNAVLADKEEKGELYTRDTLGFAAMDISIIGPQGREIEPEAPVQVHLKIKKLPGEDTPMEAAGSLEIQHHIETEEGVIVDTVYEGENTDPVFDVETDEEAAENGTAVDPDAFIPFDKSTDKNKEIRMEIDTSFSADAFSTYTISWGSRSYKIHYVDENGNSLTPTRTPEFSNGYKFLIYDVEGYEYDSTHYGSRTGTSIKPLLANYYSDRIYLDHNSQWQYLRNDIYVVYKAKSAPSQGGTPKIDQHETWPEGNDAPQFSKSSVNNGNGTNTVSLSIRAAEKPVETTTPADVIVVFDVSGSMNEYMGNQRRLARAKTAVNTMADTLLNGSNNDVRMALISFSTDAQVVQDFTGNYTTYSGKVNGLTQGGGTNWEKALKLANQIQVRDNAAAFVVFVTDGNPTFRISRGNVSDSNLDMYDDGTYQYYRDNDVFGEGDDDSEGLNFDFAVSQVSAIAGANKSFYAIGISSDVTKVQNLTTQGGVAADHAFIASDGAAMENAFKSITESIKAVLGFGAVEVTDGITDLTSTRMEMLHSVDADSFRYYRYGGEGNKYGADAAHKTEWTGREADGCGPAGYDETAGTVEWNMGDTFQLENGVTYVVEFTAWPSQEAYDLVADLNNGIRTYDGLPADEKAQVVKLDTNPVTYALKTNTDEVKATYKKTTETGGTVAVADNHPVEADYTQGTIQNMALQSMELSVRKEFEDELTDAEDRDTEVVLVLKRRNAHQNPEAEFGDYAVPQGGVVSPYIVLNEGNNWTYRLYVAPGFEVDGEVLEHGYDFTLTEPGIDYHYDLVEEIINPMVVNGEETYYGDGRFLGDDAAVEEYTDRCLTAVNRVKSGIDIKKELVDENGDPIPSDREFKITGKLLDANGASYRWQEGDDENASGAYHKYDAYGNRIIYKGHFADSGNIEFTLKPGESVRFINVPQGCTFEFDEELSSIPAGYEWKSTSAVTRHKDPVSGSFISEGDVQPCVSGSKASLTTGVAGNKQYTVTFTNTIRPIDKHLVIRKTDQNGNGLQNAVFELDVKGGNWNKVTGLPGADADGYFTIGSITVSNQILPDTVYRLIELETPEGYIKTTESICFKVHNGIIQLTDEDGNQLMDEDETPVSSSEYAEVSTNGDVLTISVKNTPGAALPDTGGSGTRRFTILGTMFLCISGVLFVKRRKRV